MEKNIKKIYDYVAERENSLYDKLNDEPERAETNVILAAQAASFQEIRYFIEEMEEEKKEKEISPNSSTSLPNKSPVMLYTDGACSGNPGPGGYAAILKYGGQEYVVSGVEENTTNNRMELSAVIEGLKALKTPSEVTVISDSKYVCDAINQHWLENWKKKNWKKSDGKPVLNPDLWRNLDKLLQHHTVKFKWIKGHAGHPENERCDAIAVNKYKDLMKG